MTKPNGSTEKQKSEFKGAGRHNGGGMEKESIMKKAVILIAILTLVATGLFAADGAAVYKTKCASCHGPDGSGLTAMGKAMKLRDLASADVQKQTDKELNTWTADGKGKMPPYKAKLSADEINAVVTYIRSLKK